MSYTSRYSSSYSSRYGDTSTRSDDSTSRYGDYSSRYGSSRTDYSSRYGDYSSRLSGKDSNGEYGSRKSSYASRYRSRLYGEDDDLSKTKESNFESEDVQDILRREKQTNIGSEEVPGILTKKKEISSECVEVPDISSKEEVSSLERKVSGILKKKGPSFEGEEVPEISYEEEEVCLERKVSGILKKKGPSFESEEVPKISSKEEETSPGRKVSGILKKKGPSFESEEVPEIPSKEEETSFDSKEVSGILKRKKGVTYESEEVQEIAYPTESTISTEEVDGDNDDADDPELKSDTYGDDEICHDADVKRNRYGDDEERSVTPQDQREAFTVDNEDEDPRMVPNSPESPQSPEPVDEVKEEAKNVDSLSTSKRSLAKEKLISETQEASEPRPYRIPINQSIPKKRVSDLIARFNQGSVESETTRKNKTACEVEQRRVKYSTTDSCLSWHSAEARKAIKTAQTTCARLEGEVLVGMTDHQQIFMNKGDIFGLDDTNHFDQTNLLDGDPGIALKESYGLDGHHVSQSYQITKIMGTGRLGRSSRSSSSNLPACSNLFQLLVNLTVTMLCMLQFLVVHHVFLYEFLRHLYVKYSLISRKIVVSRDFLVNHKSGITFHFPLL